MFGDHHHHHAHTADSPLTSYLEYGGEQGWLRETQASFDILRSSFESLQSNETKECAGTCVEVDERQKTTSLPALAPRKSIILLISFNQPHHIALPESQFPCPQTKVLAESSPSASKKSKMASSGSSSNKKAEKVLKTTDILTVTCIAIIVVSDTTNHMFIVRSYRQEKALRDPLLHPTYKGLPNVVAQEVWNALLPSSPQNSPGGPPSPNGAVFAVSLTSPGLQHTGPATFETSSVEPSLLGSWNARKVT
ncbi:hypothetical protein B0H10DRAFT_1944574 [Mycena sp. CBHHK59/15]|nr:hypothetical protein B0H10DRAFT_1944574 [Mycena sp. CBHHK59/15]